MTDLEGTTIGNYLIQKRLGMGAMGTVYLAVHTEIGKRLAIKILSAHLTEDRNMVERFMLEARAIGQLEHPNIIEMFDYGTLEDGRLYYTMEYLQGETLSQRIKRGKVTLGEIRMVLQQVCDALEVVHRNGIIHRDLKPSNLFLAQRGTRIVVKILDFGIAKIPTSGEDGEQLTSTGAVLGTPVYMSPEQALAQNFQLTHLSDIYSLGVILYKCLAGNYPIVGSLIPEVVAYHLLQEAIPIRTFNPQIPPAVEKVVMRCLRKKPMERYGSAADLCDAFTEACRGLPDEMVFVTQDMIDPDLLVSTHPRGRLPGAGVDTMNCNPAEFTTEYPETDVTNVSAEDTHHVRARRENTFLVPFSGRKRELTFIRVFLDRDAVCLEITGEPGVGKTALVNHALSTLTVSETRILRTYPEPEGFRRSWQPMADLFSRLAGLPAEPDRNDVEAACSAFETDPEDLQTALHLFCGEPEPSRLEHTVRRRELITSVARLLYAAAHIRRTLLVFEDVEDFDMVSRRVIEHLIGLVDDDRLHLIVTGRAPLLAPDPIFSKSVLHLKLDRFDNRSAQQFCRDVLTQNGIVRNHPDENLLITASGLPLHLVEGLRLVWQGVNEPGNTLSELVFRRVGILRQAQRRVLQWVAVTGGRMPGAFARDSGFLERSSIDVIPDCIQQGLLVTNDDELMLAYPLLANIVLAETAPALRAQMFRVLFEHLRDTEPDPRILAHCAIHAEALNDAVPYLEAAGSLAESLFDDHAALHHLKKAYEFSGILTQQDSKNRSVYLRICNRYGDMLRYTGAPVEGERVLREALGHCREDDPETPLILSSLARCLLETAPDYAEGQSQLAIKMASPMTDPQILFRTFFDYGHIALHTGNYERGISQLQHGLWRLEDDRNAPENLWRLHLCIARCEFLSSRSELALETCRAALERAERRGSRLACARFNEEAARILRSMNDTRAMIQHLIEAIECHEGTGDRFGRIDDLLLLAEIDDENRRRLADDAMTRALRIGYGAAISKARRLLGKS
ncbi:protein kinase [Myxococcota bacterium]|nr:protein kinase [Myxococcota bacterium]